MGPAGLTSGSNIIRLGRSLPRYSPVRCGIPGNDDPGTELHADALRTVGA